MRSRSPDVAVALLLLLTNCTSEAPETPADNYSEPGPVPTKMACEDLVSLTGYDYSISSARFVAATDDLPEYCEVRGQILPEVAFEVGLPTRWNRRFLMEGNGGFAGWLDNPGATDMAIGEFFAGARTNAGHRAPSEIELAASFAVDPQKLIDFAYRSVHVTTETAKEIISRYYDVPLEYSYFSGCSTGGRQGLMSAQRFPDDFDGILVDAPVLDQVGTVISHAWVAKALRDAPLDLTLLAERVYDQCDSIDGLPDGLIDDPRKCGFDPRTDVPVCKGNAEESGCYTSQEIEALAAVYADIIVDGERLFPGFPVGSEVFVEAPWGVVSGWDGARVGSGKPLFVAFTETFLRYMAFQRPDPDFDMFDFDFEKDPARMEWLRPIVDATNPNLQRFHESGGKLLMSFGWADQALNPLMGIEYYDRVLEEFGPSVPDFFRLFMVPGMFHCGGGVGVDSIPWLSELVRWVERGIAPERIEGKRTGELRRVGEDTIGWTRPLCPYPKVARYNGEGNIDEASNFECVNPAGSSVSDPNSSVEGRGLGSSG